MWYVLCLLGWASTSGGGFVCKGGVHAGGNHSAAAGVPAEECGSVLHEKDGGVGEQVCQGCRE